MSQLYHLEWPSRVVLFLCLQQFKPGCSKIKLRSCQPMKTPNVPAIAALIMTNVLPLVGALIFGWSVTELVIIYWIENGVIGLYNIPKIILAQGKSDNPTRVEFGGKRRSEKFFLVPFFTFHYGMFWFAHGAIAAEIFLGDQGLDISPWLVIVVMSVIFSHGVSFVTNYIGKQEYITASPNTRMFAVYGRVIILHTTVLIGGFLSEIFGNGAAAAILLILLKTIGDVFTHSLSHSKTYKLN